MRSLLAPSLPPEPLAVAASGRGARPGRRPFAARLRLGLRLVGRASAALPVSPAEARALASAALATALPTAEEERRPTARHLLLIAADLAASAYCVEAEAWLLEGRAARAAAPAALARLLALQGSGDPLVFGALEAMLGFEAWLGGHLGRSLRHFEEAVLHFTEAGDPGCAADAWGRAAVVLELAGLQPEAELAWSRARRLVEREAEAQLAEPSADSAALHQEATPAVNPHPEHGI